jgi:hypothetical protein
MMYNFHHTTTIKNYFIYKDCGSIQKSRSKYKSHKKEDELFLDNEDYKWVTRQRGEQLPKEHVYAGILMNIIEYYLWFQNNSRLVLKQFPLINPNLFTYLSFVDLNYYNYYLYFYRYLADFDEKFRFVFLNIPDIDYILLVLFQSF